MKLKHDELLSDFAFNCNLRPSNKSIVNSRLANRLRELANRNDVQRLVLYLEAGMGGWGALYYNWFQLTLSSTPTSLSYEWTHTNRFWGKPLRVEMNT